MHVKGVFLKWVDLKRSVHQGDEADSEKIFVRHKDRTIRGHNIKLSKNLVQKFEEVLLQYKVVDEWNKVHEDIVNSESIQIFKDLYDIMMIQMWLHKCNTFLLINGTYS